MHLVKHSLRIAVLAVVAFAASAYAASAQSKLPQLPGADDKARQGGTTQAAASLESGGGSALEPYLVTWLLPVSGIITLAVAVYADRSIRRSHAGRP